MGDDRGRRAIWIGIWKLIVGLVLVVASTRALLRPERDYPTALQYSNATQQITGSLTQIVILILGAGLILVWIRSVWTKPSE